MNIKISWLMGSLLAVGLAAASVVYASSETSKDNNKESVATAVVDQANITQKND